MHPLFDRFPHLESNRLLVKRMTQKDANALWQMKQNETVYRYLPTFLIERQSDDMADVIRHSYEELFLLKNTILMGVYFKDAPDTPLCGIAEIYHYDPLQEKVTVGYRLAEAFFGKGLATELLWLLRCYLFSETPIRILTASHITDNPASGRVLSKCGFRKIAACTEEDWGFSSPSLVDRWTAAKNTFSLEQLAALFTSFADSEIVFCINEQGEYARHRMGVMPDREDSSKRIFWFVPISDGSQTHTFNDFEAFSAAPVFRGRSLKAVWPNVEWLSVNGGPPEERMRSLLG